MIPLACLSHQSVAQDAALEDEDVYELSPFEVSTTESMGYMATSSLAGSRLKTELRDVAAAISVVTPEFLSDTGATTMEDLLVYTTSTEVGGLSGNFGGDATEMRRRPDRQTRIRGLNGADVTRDFFLTDIPFESYNVTQVDINRGANSVLFGLGSPAGIINYSLKTPNMVKNARSVELRYGSHGTRRASVDLDQVVIDKVLGVRVAAVDSEQKYSQDHKFDHSKRLYGVVRFTPKLGEGVYTELQASFETGETDANRPSTTPPYDYISNWFGPLEKYEHTLNLHGYNNSALPAAYVPYLANFQAGPGGNWYDSMGIVYGNPKSNEVGAAGFGGFRQRGGPDGANGSWVSPSNFASTSAWPEKHRLSNRETFANNPKAMAIIEKYEAATGKTWNGGWGWGDAQISDDSIFDFYGDSLTGPNNTQWNDFEAKTISWRQTFLDGRLGYEVVYDNQEYNDGENLLLDSDRLSVDINRTLRDEKTANPNFGRAVVVGGNSASVNNKWRENIRATVYGNLDFADIIGEDSWVSKVLGHHTFTGMASRQDFEQLSYGYSLYKMNSDYTVNVTNDSGLQGLHYLNSKVDLASATTLKGAKISGVDAKHMAPASMMAIYFGDNNAGKGIVTDNIGISSYKDNLENHYGTGPTQFKDSDTARAFIWQSWFFDDTVVGLWSVRNDDYVKTSKPSPGPEIKYGNQAVGQPFSEKWNYDHNSALRAGATKHSYGVMLHTPKFIKEFLPWGTSVSIGYNESTNFQPSQLGYDIYRNQYPSPAGSTKDYSLLITTLNDKVNLRMTKFESIQANSEIGGLSQWSVKNRLSRAMNGLMVEAWGAKGSGFSGRAQTTPENVVNKWFFGTSYDAAVANTPLPAGWTVESHPELLTQPLRLRAAALTIKEGDLNPDGVAYSEPPITTEEAEYRRAWFAARSDAEWARPFGTELFTALEFIRDYGYWGGIWRDNTPSNMKGIGDNIAEGYEVELTVNPTENWRIVANVTKTETTTGNVWAAVGEYIDNFAPVALDGWNKDLVSGTSINYWNRDGYADVDAWGNNGGQMLGWDWFNDVNKSYLIKKAGEGKSVSELRKWNVNLVSSYDFSDGALKGLGVGGAVRWQDKSIIGFYPRWDTDLGVWIDDLDSPIYADALTNVDTWVSYKRKLTDKIDWRLQLNVRNMFNDDELVPTAANPDGTIRTYRISAGRSWEITSSFDF
jgi:outer membrane receptor protein involved in Fe transport